jgi:hypothetical protein
MDREQTGRLVLPVNIFPCQPEETQFRLSELASRHERLRRNGWFGGVAVSTFGVVLIGLACTTDAAESGDKIDFSIPAQPLNSAISRYGDATGHEGLYEARLATGRISNNVQGTMTPSEALERLLIGTGLSAQFVSRRRFVIKPSPTAPGPAQDAVLSPAHLRYYGLVQRGLLDTLCGLRETRPGHYRMILALRIARTGAIEHAHRVGTTGRADADRQIDAALPGVRFGEGPPVDFAQPIRILLSPQVPGGPSACADADVPLGVRGGPR